MISFKVCDCFFRGKWGRWGSLAPQVLKVDLDLLALLVFQELKEFRGQK